MRTKFFLKLVHTLLYAALTLVILYNAASSPTDKIHTAVIVLVGLSLPYQYWIAKVSGFGGNTNLTWVGMIVGVLVSFTSPNFGVAILAVVTIISMVITAKAFQAMLDTEQEEAEAEANAKAKATKLETQLLAKLKEPFTLTLKWDWGCERHSIQIEATEHLQWFANQNGTFIFESNSNDKLALYLDKRGRLLTLDGYKVIAETGKGFLNQKIYFSPKQLELLPKPSKDLLNQAEEASDCFWNLRNEMEAKTLKAKQQIAEEQAALLVQSKQLLNDALTQIEVNKAHALYDTYFGYDARRVEQAAAERAQSDYSMLQANLVAAESLLESLQKRLANWEMKFTLIKPITPEEALERMKAS